MKAYLAEKYMSGPKADAILSKVNPPNKKKRKATAASASTSFIKDDDLTGWGNVPKDGDEDEDDDLPEFPVTHELLLKDHTKVVSALTLDPSGARILSGSHVYDCKLWDFGGMDARCKPFKTWEPAGTYYVRHILSHCRMLTG